jgi:hypothetical protein
MALLKILGRRTTGPGVKEISSADFVDYPRLAIADGDTAPNPGTVGATIVSTITQDLMYWNGTSWSIGTSFTTIARGVVPSGGSNTTFLRGDGTWATPAGGGAFPDIFTISSGRVNIGVGLY